jgi:hypothetical protein
MNIAKNVMLASLEIRGWAATKRDVAASLEVAEFHGLTDKRMARVWKTLLPRNEALYGVLRVTRQAREWHYQNTLPWKCRGPRMLPCANYMDYTEAVRRFGSALDAAVSHLVTSYDGLKEEARMMLNSMYRGSDYPSALELQQAFAINLSIDPMPSSDTMLKLQIDPSEIARLRAEHEQEMAETFRRANEDLWQRLYAAIQSFHSQVIDPKRSVREATFKNLRQLLPILERLNVTGDGRLEQMRLRMESALDGVTIEGLKDDPVQRLRAAREADRVFSAMAEALGYSGHEPALEAA